MKQISKIGIRTGEVAVTAWLMVPGKEAMLLASVNRQICEIDAIVLDQFKTMVRAMAGALFLHLYDIAPDEIKEEPLS